MVNTRDKMRDACDAQIKNHNSFDLPPFIVSLYCHEKQNVECDQTKELNK